MAKNDNNTTIIALAVVVGGFFWYNRSYKFAIGQLVYAQGNIPLTVMEHRRFVPWASEYRCQGEVGEATWFDESELSATPTS